MSIQGIVCLHLLRRTKHLIFICDDFRYDKISSTGTKAADTDKKTLWCATEKIHGANFSIYLWPSGHIKCAKRTGFIQDGDSFFDHFDAVERYRDNILAMSKNIFERYNCEYIILFGELFGGIYPECHLAPRRVPVQSGVCYCPQIEFMIFDICIKLAQGMTYLPFSTTVKLGKQFGLFFSEPLCIGPLHEVLQFESRFASTIPARLGLPPPSDSSVDQANASAIVNIAEGIVVRMYNAEQIHGSDRRMVKIKVSEFSEGECPPIMPDTIHLTNWILSLANPNRINAAISKIGCPSPKDSNILQQIVEEVLKDLREECGISTLGT